VTLAEIPPAMGRVIAFLGDLGPRWGLPREACRVHGYLYLLSKPIAEEELRDALDLSETALVEALTWLAEYGLIERVRSEEWRTDSDPWQLMIHALQERQRREIGPALALLRDCRKLALADRGHDRAVAAQVDKLLQLVEDLAAISAQAQRLPASALRQMVGLGGAAARFIDFALGRRSR
jgi:DNA-binding transcriptional regulator GbsR (MarR family)